MGAADGTTVRPRRDVPLPGDAHAPHARGDDDGARPVDDGRRLPVRDAQGADRDRLPLVPPFTRRPLQVPFRLAHPVWIEDPALRPGQPRLPGRCAGAGRPPRAGRPRRPDRQHPLPQGPSPVADLGDRGPQARPHRRRRQGAPLGHRRCVGRRDHGPDVRPRARRAAAARRPTRCPSPSTCRPTSSCSGYAMVSRVRGCCRCPASSPRPPSRSPASSRADATRSSRSARCR